MRKGLIVIFIFFIIASMFSCSNVYDEKIISDIKLYDTVWNLPERRIVKTSILFPVVVEEEQVTNFNCKHTTYQLLGTGWQIELAVKYNDDSFFTEKKRLSEVCEDSIVCGNSKYFDLPAYATVWNWNSCFEYAVINEEEKTIGYIYLQLIEKKDLTIDPCYIPKQYEMEQSDSQGYSIYS